MGRRQYGTGSVYQLSNGKWRGAFDAGSTAAGGRRRITVTGKTEAEAKRKLRDRINQVTSEGATAGGKQQTVKSWAATWLEITERTLAPKTWTTNRGQVRRWIVPTIGHKRLSDLSHADIRAVASAQQKAGQSVASRTRTKSVLLKMLKDAVAEGHHVPAPVVAVQPRRKRVGRTTDRQALTIEQALTVLGVARKRLPHHSRWDMAFLEGLRQGEALGLTWANVDLDEGVCVVEWQLQALPYLDKHDRSKGFRVPDDFEARQLDRSLHLVRPKTKAGERVIPLVPWAVDTLTAWRDVAPSNPHDLVWTRADGRPIDKHDDLEEWKGLQRAAEIRHPAGRYFLGHEIRNTTATLLSEAGVDPYIITAILGHTDIETSRGYMTRRAQQARPAMEAVARALQLGA